jgi:DNA gyrase subunit A
LPLYEDKELAVYSNDSRTVVFSSSILAPKTTRSTQGVQVMSLKRGRIVTMAMPLEQTPITTPARYRVRALPAAGAILKPEDKGEEQMEMEFGNKN